MKKEKFLGAFTRRYLLTVSHPQKGDYNVTITRKDEKEKIVDSSADTFNVALLTAVADLIDYIHRNLNRDCLN